MRRLIVIGASIIGVMLAVVLALPINAAAEDGEALTIVEPLDGAVISTFQTPDFRLTWTEDTDALFYLVRVYMPADAETGYERFVEYRYVLDTGRDWRRDNPYLWVTTGLLDLDEDHQIVITPMGASEKLLAEYTDDYLPTDLSLDYYVALAPASEPVTIHVVP